MIFNTLFHLTYILTYAYGSTALAATRLYSSWILRRATEFLHLESGELRLEKYEQSRFPLTGVWQLDEINTSKSLYYQNVVFDEYSLPATCKYMLE